MRITAIIIVLSIYSLLLNGCRKSAPVKSTNCDQSTIIDAGLYNNGPSSLFGITSAAINGNCLAVTVSSSGCDGRSWVVKMVDSGNINTTGVPKRFLKVLLTNQELCDAMPSRQVSFDISSLQINGSNSVTLVLAGWGTELTYHY